MSIGVCAFNERDNISKLLDGLLQQQLSPEVSMKEVIVVASGCTDDTEEIVKGYMDRDSRVKLLIQEKREGKASAINLFLEHARGSILVLESADTLPGENMLSELIKPFSNPDVGLTSGHPVPVNSRESFIGYTVNLVWGLHHRLSLHCPKATEVMAFRPLVEEIDHNTAVDDFLFEYLIKDRGYRLEYAPNAVVYNKGPENVRDLVRQRVRIHIGYLYTKDKTHGYEPLTVKSLMIFRELLSELEYSKPRHLAWALGAVFLEAYIRLRARLDYHILKRNPAVWEIAESTKKLE